MLTRLVHGPGTDELLARQTPGGGTIAQNGTRWYVLDRQNSVMGLVTPQPLTNAEGNTQDPNGLDELTTPAGSWVKVATYGSGGADRVWGRDHNTNSAFDSADVIRDEFEYTGRLWDNRTQFQFNRARWPNPATGQFMGKDSYGYKAGDANLYRYAANDPVNVTDPTGHYSALYIMAGLTIGGAAAGFLYGGLTGSGGWDMQKAWAGAASGAIIGAGIGLLAIGGVGSAVFTGILTGALIGAGVGGIGSFESGKTVDWDKWQTGTAIGGISGAVSGGVGAGVGGGGGGGGCLRRAA